MALAGSSTTPDQTVADLQSLQRELVGVISAAQRAQDTLGQALLGADARNKVLRAKIEDLETQNLERAFKIRALERENAELQERLAGAGHAPDSDNGRVVEERDRALRNVEKAHKLIKRLLKGVNPACTCEAGQLLQPDFGATSSQSQPVRRAVDSDDESTVRPPRSVASTRGRGTPVPPPTRTERPRISPVSPVVPETPVSSQESISTMSSASTSSDAASSASRARMKDKVDWYLEFDKLPATVEMRHGPIPFDILSQRLGFDGEIEMEIESLETMPGYDTRMFTGADVAFAFRPYVLEGPDSTYLIGWGSAEMVKRREASTKTLGDMNLFIWPMKQDAGWFYVGLHSFTFVELGPMWSKLRKIDKQRLLAELSERNPDMDTAKFRKDVKEGRIQQYCLELESLGRAESLDFMREYGLLAGD